MEGTVVCGEIIYIDASHVRLDGCKDIRNIDSQLFTFFPVNRKIVIGSVRRIKTVCMSNRRIFIGLIDKPVDYFFECVNIVIGVALFYLETETAHRPYTRNG